MKKTSPGQISLDSIKEYQENFEANPAYRVAMNAVTRGNLNELTLNRTVLNETETSFSHEFETGPITDQKAAGTCWLFAELNWLRTYVNKKWNMKGFVFSENFVIFWDKFEKSNYFLENIIDTRRKDLDDRTVHHLLASPAGDGGEWNMLVNIIGKYGLIPKSAMPDTFNRESSRYMNGRLFSVLRSGAKLLREAGATGTTIGGLRKIKKDILNDVYRLLAIFLGEPPKTFSWGWRDEKKRFHRETNMTPLAFYKKYVPVDPTKTITLLSCDLPETKYYKTYQVKYFQNMHQGTELTFLNIPMAEFKKLAIAVLKKKEAVLFGCEVRHAMHSKEGIMDVDLFDFDLMFDTKSSLTRAEKMQYHESCMTHAMVFTGVDLDKGRSKRWKVENSWGEQFGKKGFFVMSDEWFEQNVFELVLLPKHVPEKLRKLAKQKPTVLPPWHPLS